MPKFYVNTAIAYVNAKPHIGYAMELIQADVLARYHRLKGDATWYVTGTDEHGMKLAQTAKDQNTTPQQLVDQNATFFKELVQILDISADDFIRTTDPHHKKGAQKIWQKMVDAGDIYKDSYEGLYCVGCEAFVLEKDLIDGKCPNHNKVPEKLKEENYFFKLSKYNDRIKKAIQSDELKILPVSRKHEILAVLEEGLKDVSFSRPKNILEWGIEVPNDPTQVMYVWCDALSNYITTLGYAEESDRYKKFWPTDVNIIGKDILRFHAAIWIGMLFSAQLPIPRAIYVHGFITSEGKKMSKSLNNVVDPVEYIEKYGADALRYFLLKEIPTTEDGDFSKERFKVVYESELANNIGNLVSRVIAMTGKYFDFNVPVGNLNDAVLTTQLKGVWSNYEKAIADFDLKKALEITAELANSANKYVEEKKPWILAKDPSKKPLEETLYALLEMIRHIALLLTPFLPATSRKIFSYLGIVNQAGSLSDKQQWGVLKDGTQLQKAEPLFVRIEA